MAEDLYHQSKTMIWRDIVNPGYEIQYETAAMDTGSDSDFDSDDSLDDLQSQYTDIDVNNVLGRSIAIWAFNRPDSLTLFTPRPDDTLYNLIKYAEQNLSFNREREKIMVMDPGDKTPKEIKEMYALNPGSVIMVMPAVNTNLLVEVNQLKAKFPISVDPACTVLEVKSYIRRVKGISIDQQDILYRDKVLENSRRLLEYRVKKGTTLHVLIQVHFDILINVETFWGKHYRLYVDRCSTGSDIISTIFGRTFSKHGPGNVMVHELYVPIHVLVLQHNKCSIHWDYCLGFFGIKNGDTLVITTVGKQSDMNVQPLTVVSELGESFEVNVSQFDRWAVVAFILHGLTEVPVDLIRLFKDKQQVDFTSMVGDLPRKSAIIMNIKMTKVDDDLVVGIPIRVSVGNGIIENVRMAPMKKVKDVKNRLESIGVPNASLYELTNGNYKLPHNSYLKDVIRDLKSLLYLKIEKFPVFVHAPDGIIYKNIVDVNHTLQSLKFKIEMKSGHAMSNCRLLLAGQELKLHDDAIMYENNFSTRTSLFVESSTFTETFFITKGDLLVKIKLPIRPRADEIKRCIWKCRDIPEGSITCLQTFLFWFFLPRVSKKNQLTKKRKSQKRLPAALNPLLELSDRVPRQKNIQDTDPKTHYDRVHNKRYKPSKSTEMQTLQNENSWPLTRKHEYIQNPEIEMMTETQYDLKSYRNAEKPQRPRRRHTYREPRERIKYTDHEPRKVEVIHHVQPRWMDNLYQKNDHHRLMAMNETGFGQTRQNPQNPSLDPEPVYTSRRQIFHSRSQPKYVYPVQNQGDASTARYFHNKMAFDRQEVNYGTSSESDDETVYLNGTPRIRVQ